MIQVVAKNADKVTFRVSARRLPVYLDNWAIIALAKDRTGLRERFLNVLNRGADLLFSETSAAEIVGPTGASQDAVREFLGAIGPNWLPVEGLGLAGVMEREARGEGANSCISSSLLQRFYAGRSIQLYGEQRLDFVPPGFFDLGFFLDWLVPQKQDIELSFTRFDAVLRERLRDLRRAYDQHRSRFDLVLPRIPFDPSMPMTFCWQHMLRLLVVQGKAFQWKRGDSADFCHALMGASHAQFATLDKQWQRRIQALPPPNSLASIYSQPELEAFVDAVETAVDASPRLRFPGATEIYDIRG